VSSSLLKPTGELCPECEKPLVRVVTDPYCPACRGSGGGRSKSPSKIAAVRQNLTVARTKWKRRPKVLP